MSKYETFKRYATRAGGVIGGGFATYLTTIYLPAKIIRTTTAAATAAMNATLGSTAPLFARTINDTAAVAGAEAYIGAKGTGYVGTSYTAIFGSFGAGYMIGSKAVEYTFTGMETVYDGVNSLANKWTNKIEEEKKSQFCRSAEFC